MCRKVIRCELGARCGPGGVHTVVRVTLSASVGLCCLSKACVCEPGVCRVQAAPRDNGPIRAVQAEIEWLLFNDLIIQR